MSFHASVNSEPASSAAVRQARRARGWLATAMALALAGGAWAQSLTFTDAAQNPVTTYTLGTDPIFVVLVDAAANVSVGGTNDTTSLTALDIPGADTETSGLVLNETATPGTFFGPAGGFPSAFGTFTLNNGTLEAGDGATLQAIYTPQALNTTVTMVKPATPSTVRLLDNALADETLYFLDTDTAVLQVEDQDEDRDPGAQDTVSALVTVNPGGDTETLVLTETGNSTGIFRRAEVPTAGVANSGDGVIQGSSGAQLTLSFTDPEGGAATVDVANLLQITASQTEITNSGGTAIGSQGLPSSLLFVTVFDGDQNLDFATQQQVQVRLASTDTGDIVELTLDETTNNSGVFRNPVGLPVVQAQNANLANGTLETDHLATITATYPTPASPAPPNADGSTDSVPALVVSTPSVTRLTNAAQATQSIFQAPGDQVFVRVDDADQNLDADVAESVSVTLQTSNAFNPGDTETVNLTETGPNTGVFFSAGVNLVRSPTPVSANGSLEVLEGDALTATYTDPNDGGDQTTFNAGINVITSAVLSFVPTSTAPVGADYQVGDSIIVRVTDLDENADPTVAESVTATVAHAATGDTETVTLIETGADTSTFENVPLSLISAVSLANPGDNILDVIVRAQVTGTYTDPNDGSDVATDTAQIFEQPDGGSIAFTDGGGNAQGLFFIGIQDLFVTLTDSDENKDAATPQTVTVSVIDSATGDTESLDLVETGNDTGVFRNAAGLPSSITSDVPFNGLLETSDASPVSVTFLDPDDSTTVSGFATMRVTQTASVTALTDSTGAVVATYRVDTNPANSDLIFVTVTDVDENTQAASPQTITSAVTVRNLTTGEEEFLDIVETGDATGVFRNTVGLTISLAAGAPTTDDGVLFVADGDIVIAEYEDNDFVSDDSSDTAVIEFKTGSITLLTDQGGAVQSTYPLNSTTDLIFITVFDEDQNLDDLALDTVTVNLRHVPPTAGEGIFGIVLTEITSSAGVFRNLTGVPAEVAPAVVDGVLQSFDGAQIQAEYSDPSDVADTSQSSLATLRTTPTQAQVVITDSSFSTTQFTTFTVGTDDVFVTVIDEDQDLSATVVDTLVVTLVDLTTGDSVSLTLSESVANSDGVFSNVVGVPLQIAQNTAGLTLETAHQSTFVANYEDPTPSDPEFEFDSAVAVIAPVAPVTLLTDGAGVEVDPFLIGVDQVFVSVADVDENRNGSSQEVSSVVTVTSPAPANDTETLSLIETSLSTGAFRSSPGLPIELAAVGIPNNGILEVASVGDTIQGCYEDRRDPGIGATDCDNSTVDLPPSGSTTRFTNSPGSVQTVFTIGAGDIFVTVTDSDKNIQPGVVEVLSGALVVSASITGDSESLFDLTETGADTGVFRTLGINSEIDVGANDDLTLQVAGASVLTATYTDPADGTDVSTHTATLTVPQVSGGAFLITTDVGSIPPGILSTEVFIGNDLLFVMVEDIDSNTDPTTTETVDVLVTGTGGAGGGDSVLVTLAEQGPNSRFFYNDGASLLPGPVTTATTGLTSVVDPVDTGDFLLQTFDLEVVQASFVDPQDAGDTRTTTTQMKIFEDLSTLFFSDGAGATKAEFLIGAPAAADRVFVTLIDPDENTNASSPQSVVVTITDPTTFDVVTLTLTETGNDTDTFRNTLGVASTVAASVPADGILQSGEGSVIQVTYIDDDSVADTQTSTAIMRVAQQAGAVAFTDVSGNARLTYRMVNVPSELIFVTVTDPDENRSPIAADTVTVTLEALFNGDVESLVLTETGLATGVFRNSIGVQSQPGCLPTTDGVIQAANGTTLRVDYTDPDPELPGDTSFDLATLLNAPSAATLDYLDNLTDLNTVTTFDISSSAGAATATGVLVEVQDTDENENPCNVEFVTVSLVANASGDTETVTLTETGASTGLFRSTTGIVAIIDPPVNQDFTLQVKHPTDLTATYIDNDTIGDQEVVVASSVMFETSATAFFVGNLAGDPFSGTYGIGIDRIFIDVFDEDQDQDYETQESFDVTLFSTGTMDIVTVTLLETAAHTGLFRNLLPTPPEVLEGIPSEIGTTNSTDATIQTSGGEELFGVYVDPTDPTDISTAIAFLELQPTTSTTQFTDNAGTTRSFYSIQFDQIFVTTFDPDENADPTQIETITVQITANFPSPATPDVESLALFETGPSTSIFRNTTGLPMDIAASLPGDGVLQVGDGLEIIATYQDFDDASDISTSTARTFAASTNCSVTFTDLNVGGAVFQYFVGGNDIFVEVTDFDENTNGNSTQSVVVQVEVTSTGDVESFVLEETDDFGSGAVTAIDSQVFRTPVALPIQSILAGAGSPGNGILEVVDGAFLTARYTDDDFALDTCTNTQSVRIITAPTTSTLRVLNQSFQPVSEFLVVQDSVVIEVDDFDQNGNPSVADTILVTIDLGSAGFDLETVTGTEIGPNAGIFRTPAIPTVQIFAPSSGTAENGVLQARGDTGVLGDDFFTVSYRDPTDGLDTSSGFGTITTQVDSTIVFTNSVLTPVTTYTIGVDRVRVRVIDRDENTSTSTPQTLTVTVTDFGTGDVEPILLTETGNDTGVFFNVAGIPTVFDLTPVPGDGVLQTGNPSSTTAEAEYQDPDEVFDNQFVSVDVVPLDPNDRDGDGIPNAIENATPGMNENDPTDATLDFDDDGRDNRTELIIDGTDPNDDTDNAPVPVIAPNGVTVNPGVIRLDGSASFDQTVLPPNIGIVAFLWTQVGSSPTGITFSDPTGQRPFFVARTPGAYTVQLRVTDADGAQRTATATITVADVPPTADAGPAGAMRFSSSGAGFAPFQLDGSRSEDANDQALSFQWTVGPGSDVGTVTFSPAAANQAQVTVTNVQRPGRMVLRLTVTEVGGLAQSSFETKEFLVHDDLSVTPFLNHAPTADAGLDRVITAQTAATSILDGSGSTDQDGDPLTFAWTYLPFPPDGPPGPKPSVTVLNPTASQAVATDLDQVGVYTFQLQVRDTHVGPPGTASSEVQRVRVIAQTLANHVPTADAGGPYNAAPLGRTQLDGSGSSDADPGDTLTFQWTQVGGVATALEDATVAQPFVTFYKPGVYEYSLTVTDAAGNRSIPSIARIQVGRTGDNPPVANAGVDSIANSGQLVQLDGTLSADPDGSPLTFYWRQVGGTRLLLDDRTSPQPRFTPTRAGNYVFELIVDDGTHFSGPSRVTVAVDPPVGNAGPDQNLFLGSGGSPITVNLDGTGSFDPIPGPSALTFTWTQVAGPTVTLSDPNSSQPSFSAAVAGTYRFLLVVNDGNASSPQVDLNTSFDPFVRITVSNALNTIPSANAGSDQFVTAGAVVTLDGSASFDVDGDTLSFLWVQLSGPPVNLVGANTATPTFLASVGGSAYTFRLTVSDPTNQSASDQVAIFATGGSTGAGAGNPLPQPADGTTFAFADGGGGGGCAAVPLYVQGEWTDHWAQALLNLLLLLLPALTALSYRRQAYEHAIRRPTRY